MSEGVEKSVIKSKATTPSQQEIDCKWNPVWMKTGQTICQNINTRPEK
jgi:hypothetical protein